MKLRRNYEKLLLGGAALVAIGFCSSIYVNAKRADKDFQLPLLVGPAKGREHLIVPVEWNIEAKPITHRVFVGDPLFVNRDGEAVDLSDPRSRPVHRGIPNAWWEKHGIDPTFVDTPERDADRDGFSNREEFVGKTNPRDRESHPPLIGKLRVEKLERVAISLTYSGHDCLGVPKAGDKFSFRYTDSVGRRNREAGIVAGAGPSSVFFAKGEGHLRFELKEVVRGKVFDPRINGVRDAYTATIVDRRPNKQGREYKVEKGSKRALTVNDDSVTFVLDALGQSQNPIVVEENTTFTLSGARGSEDLEYRFKGVRVGAKGQEVVVASVNAAGVAEFVFPVPTP